VREDGAEYDLTEEDAEEALDAGEDEEGMEKPKTFDPFSDSSSTKFGFE